MAQANKTGREEKISHNDTTNTTKILRRARRVVVVLSFWRFLTLQALYCLGWYGHAVREQP